MSRWLFLVLLLVLPRLLQAQAGPDTTVVLPEVEVEADREAGQTAEGRLTVLGPDAIAATAAQTVADVLEARTGLFVKRYGGGLATLSLRGTGSAHTLLLLDGLRIADPQSGQVDLSLLPAILLESVEVFHGASSARYGSDALGGVVHLHTLRADGPVHLKVSGSYGAFEERGLGAVAAGGGGRLSGIIAVEANQADGDFLYRNEALFPPRDVRREGAGRALVTLFGRTTYRTDRSRLTAAAWVNRAERGLPGPGNAPPGAAQQTDRYLRLWAEGERRLPLGIVTLRGSMQRTALHYTNPASATDATTHARTIDLDATARFIATPRWLAEGGVAAGHDQADLRDGVRQLRLGSFLHGSGTYGRWMLFPALRFDAYTSEGRTNLALSPRLSINGQPTAWAGLRVKASVGRAFRMPTFNERFWQPGGNPELEPERGWSADAGLHLRHARHATMLEAELTGFAARLRDQVVWFPSLVDAGVQVWRPANVSMVVTRGIEASMRGRGRLARAALDGGLAFTFTDARDRSDPAIASFDQPLRYVPPVQMTSFFGIDWHALRLDVSARFVGRRYITSDASMAMPAYQILDAQLRYTHTFGPASATLALAMENLLDADYAVIRFYPMPPRHARLRLTIDLTP